MVSRLVDKELCYLNSENHLKDALAKKKAGCRPDYLSLAHGVTDSQRTDLYSEES